MGDSRSAKLFGKLFEHFARASDKPGAHKFYLEARGYDFSTDEMGCDDALVHLDLARWVRDERGEVTDIEYWIDDYEEEPNT